MKKILTSALIIALLLSVIPGMALAATGTQEPSVGYSDIAGGWYQASVEKYGYVDIFDSGDGKFYPNKKITRMEFARLLHKALGIEINYFVAPDITDSFDDVKNEDLGAGALIDLVTVGIIAQGGSFFPNNQLDRDEMIHYIIKGLDHATGGDYAIIKIMPEPFADDDQIKPEYKADIVKAVIMNLVKGVGNNMLLPGQGATRAEAVTVVDRLTALIKSLTIHVDVTASATETKDGLLMSLTIQNNSDKTITINYNSGQQFDFKLLDQTGESLYTWSADKLFIQALTKTEIKAGEKVEFSDTLDIDSYDQIKGKVNIMKAYITGSSDDFTVNPDGYIAVIS